MIEITSPPQSKSLVSGNHLINMSQIREQNYGCCSGWRTETEGVCLKKRFGGEVWDLGEIMEWELKH